MSGPGTQGDDSRNTDAEEALITPKAPVDEADQATYSSYIVPLFIPALLSYVAESVLVPVLPGFVVDNLGRSITDAGFASSLTSFVRVFMNIPAGFVIGMMGYRYALFVASLLCALPSLCVGFWPTFSMLIGTRFVYAIGAATFNVARQAVISDFVPMEKRGKTNSILGGMMRIGVIVGPLIGGIIATRLPPNTVFYVQAGVSGLLAIWTFFSTPEPKGGKKISTQLGFRYVLSKHWRELAQVSPFVVLLQTIRTGAEFIVRVRGLEIGLSSDKIGFVVSATSATGLCVFMLGGYISDRWGRKKVAVPGALGLAVSVGLLGYATDLGKLIMVSTLGGFANGFASGIVLTLGADFTPPEARSAFLGIYALTSDAGMGLGPMAAGTFSDRLHSTADVGYILAGVGVLAALWIIIVCPETKEKDKQMLVKPLPDAKQQLISPVQDSTSVSTSEDNNE